MDNELLERYAEENIITAHEYLDARNEYAEAKLYMDVQLALNLPELREVRSNIGYDMSLIMLVEKTPEIKPYYEDMVKNKNRYKGLDKVMNAISTRISLGQSLIKNKIQEGG